MILPRPHCLSIAGYDPSGGAGVLADIKTFEASKVYGLAVVSGNTFQNDSEFEGVNWIAPEDINKQLNVLCRKFPIEYIKIGMLRDFKTLSSLISYLKSTISNPKIIWDPILKTSSGFEIHDLTEKSLFLSICRDIFLLTPNIDEIKMLMNEPDPMKAALELSGYCNVFLKGGHIPKEDKTFGKDYLFTTDGKKFPFRPKKISTFSKHGSGCVLSSAITANLAKGESLLRSCLKGKNYVTDFFMSNKSLLGYHRI